MTQASPADTDSPLYVQSIAKAFQILHAFDGPRREMTLADIAKSADMGRSAVQRIVYTLESLGYLERVPDSKHYRLTSRLLQFSFNYVRNHELIARSLPYLQELNRNFDETVNLQELDGTDIVLVARFLSRQIMNVEVAVGSRLPAFCTASGTAILSRLPEAEYEAILAASNLMPLTPHTETDPARLRQRIQQAAYKGYSALTNEAVMGDISLAAPILDHRGRPVAAVNISVPTVRWTLEQAEAEFSSYLQAAAMALSGAKFNVFKI